MYINHVAKTRCIWTLYFRPEAIEMHKKNYAKRLGRENGQ